MGALRPFPFSFLVHVSSRTDSPSSIFFHENFCAAPSYIDFSTAKPRCPRQGNFWLSPGGVILWIDQDDFSPLAPPPTSEKLEDEFSFGPGSFGVFPSQW